MVSQKVLSVSSTKLLLYVIIHRGESFREDYAKLGELRSVVPNSVKFMALTATASPLTRECIIRSLFMVQPKIVYATPQKKNIMYSVKKKIGIEDFVREIATQILAVGKYMPRMIVFCKQYDQCSAMYSLFKQHLGPNFTIPSSVPDLSKYRVVDMFTRCTEAEVKESILNSFSKPNGNLRIVIGTIAFGMGLDCPNVRQIVHWGPSSCMELYVQEVGRCGRDDYVSRAVLYHGSADYRYCSSRMVEYCKNITECRRVSIFKDFDESETIRTCTLCSCCDICMSKCNCKLCLENKNPFNCAFVC